MSMPGNQQPQQGGTLFLTVAQNIVTAINGLSKAFSKAFPSISGTFTMPAAPTFAVAQPALQSNSVVTITPTNAAAGTLQGSTKALYVTITAGTGFTVSTADGTNPATATATFSYAAFTP